MAVGGTFDCIKYRRPRRRSLNPELLPPTLFPRRPTPVVHVAEQVPAVLEGFLQLCLEAVAQPRKSHPVSHKLYNRTFSGVVARLANCLDIAPADHVVDVGSGDG